MSGPYPSTDLRRKRELLQQLQAVATRFVPTWRGLTEPDDPARTLLQLGADLAEHVTSRLDDTAERDLKAFLHWLDLPGANPTSAKAWAVFTLSDKLDGVVQVRERIQMSAAGSDGEEVFFETLDRLSLTLTPARLETLFGVDPSSDRIETAPRVFGSLEPPVASDPRYELLSFAAAASKQVQITPPTGLEKGDWVRIDGAAYVIEEEKDGIYTIDPGLDAAAAAETAVSRVTRFQLGAMRNLQRHIFYLGHKELLNLEQGAAIDLHILPAGRAAWLATREVAWELWAKRDGEDTADWQALEAAIGTSSVHLRKAWIGKTEERQVSGKKSRWLRARLLEPMVDNPLSFRCDRVELQLRSEPPPPGADAPATVTAAFHNATPLPVPGPLLPLGPEPRLFDQFYLAAPEALSKKGARVTLSFEFADASMAAVTAGVTPETTVVGVGRNGRVQVLHRGLTPSREWRELPGPDPKKFGLDAATSGVRFSSAHSPAILSTSDPLKTLILVEDESGPFWLGELSWSSEPPRPQVTWALLEPPPLPSTALGTAAYVALATDGERQLLVADDKTVWGRRLSATGQPLASWSIVGTLSGSIRELVPVRQLDGAAPTGMVIRIADQSLLLVPELSALGSAITLSKASEKIEIDAIQEGDDQLVAAAGPDGRSLQFWSRGTSSRPRSAFVRLSPGRSTASVPVPGGLVGGSRTVVTDGLDGVPGSHVVFLQSLGDVATLRAWRVDSNRIADLGSHPGVGGPIAGPVHVAGDEGERIVIADENQRLRLIDPNAGETVALAQVALHTAIAVPRTDARFFAELEPDSDSSSVWPVTTTMIVEGDRAVALIDQDAPDDPENDKVKLWRDRSPTRRFVGTVIDKNTLRLHADDRVTRPDRIIAFRHRKFHVDSITSEADGKHAHLEEAIDLKPGDDPRVHYWSITQVAGGLVQIQKGRVFSLPPKLRPLALRLSRIRIDGNGDFAVVAVDPTAEWVLLDRASNLKIATALTVQTFPESASWQALTNADATNNPELSWEYFDSRGWRRLDDMFSDTTANFSNTGLVKFKVPKELTTTKIGGQEDYWIRARLIGGDYGQPSFLIDATPDPANPLLFDQKITIDRSNVHPPEIFSIDASFELAERIAAELTLVDNNLALVDQTAAAGADGAVFDLFAAAATIDRGASEPALYLAFSKPFAADALRLLVHAEEQEGAMRLAWEVFADGRWQDVRLDGDDPTRGLLRSGIITLDVGAKPTRNTFLGRTSYWLRARPLEAGTWQPDLVGIYPNAAPAEQAETVRDELLGSTTGEPNAQFALTKKPVLPGSVELRVRERLGSEEREALTDAQGNAAVARNLPDLPGEWVLWREVESFVDAGPDARVFMLNPRTGVVRFGDDRQGRIPPAGADNVRAFKYRAGGGRKGNVAAHAVTSLKSTVTGVESVTNPLPTRGGSDGRDDVGSAAQAMARVRHVNRAITPRDVEALALDYAPEIVRARCIRPNDLGDKVVVALAIADTQQMPQPSVAMRDGLASHLTERAASSWPEAAFKVVGPEYVRLRVKVELALAPNSPATLPSQVRDRLLALLHPITGGHDGTGWPFGRGLWASDVHRGLADTLGEARIAELEVGRVDGRGAASTIGPTAIITATRDDITVEPSEAAR